jgi:hypothetical protein
VNSVEEAEINRKKKKEVVVHWSDREKERKERQGGQ